MMNLNRQIMDSERIVKLRYEAERLVQTPVEGAFINPFRRKIAAAKLALADELERELRFDAQQYYGSLS